MQYLKQLTTNPKMLAFVGTCLLLIGIIIGLIVGNMLTRYRSPDVKIEQLPVESALIPTTTSSLAATPTTTPSADELMALHAELTTLRTLNVELQKQITALASECGTSTTPRANGPYPDPLQCSRDQEFAIWHAGAEHRVTVRDCITLTGDETPYIVLRKRGLMEAGRAATDACNQGPRDYRAGERVFICVSR